MDDEFHSLVKCLLLAKKFCVNHKAAESTFLVYKTQYFTINVAVPPDILIIEVRYF